jgi:hypothetical protein
MRKVERTRHTINTESRSAARRSGRRRRQGGGILRPQIAIRADGALLLSTADLGDRDISGREVFTAVVVRPDEEGPVRRRFDDAAALAAAELTAKLPKRGGGGS